MKKAVIFSLLLIIILFPLTACKKKETKNEEEKEQQVAVEEQEVEEPLVLTIKEVNSSNTKFTVTVEVNKEVEKYKVVVLDNDINKILEEETEEEIITFNVKGMKNNNNYTIIVYALYDDEYIECTNPYTFIWRQVNMNVTGNVYVDNQPYTIKFNGDIKSDNYKIKIIDNNQVVKEEVLTDNSYTIGLEYYQGVNKTITVVFMRNDEEISKLNIINEINPITDLMVESPKTTIVPYNDVEIIISGGDNTTSHLFKVYRGNVLIDTTDTKYKRIGIPKKLLKPSTEYRVEVTFSEGKFKKTKTIKFTTESLPQANPVYISNNYNNIKPGSTIELQSDNDNAKIYYTIDGTDPTSSSMLYNEPITIESDVTLKTVAIQSGYTNSIIETYNIKTNPKNNLVIYLSPSNQYKNYGSAETNYSNERDEMNDLANYVQARLESYGVKVYRNKPEGTMDEWLTESKNLGADLHLAIHSNASGLHDQYGPETWIDNVTSNTFSLASLIQKKIYSIYPHQDLPGSNRGIKLSHASLAEANDERGPCSMLIEVAHHDFKMDAEWIMNSKEEIGNNIADTILKYYQII